MTRLDNWMPADGLILEPNALVAAKETRMSQAVIAGPGAGKTEMLAQRADFLLRTGISRYPKRILAISFKVDASRNLKDRVKRRCGMDLSSRFDSYTFHAFAKHIIDRFRPMLTGSDTLDFDYTIGAQKVARRQITFSDLVPLAITVLERSPLALNAIRQTYSDVFLDEFQDCTDQQYGLIKLIFQERGTRLTAVGDTKQKIMGWAGALEGIFVTYSEDFNANSMNLYRNFRSMPALLRMQNTIIRVLDAPASVPDEEIKGQGGVIDVQRFNNNQEEAESLAEQVLTWLEDGIPHSEIAVLVSQQVDLYGGPLAAALEARGIPFRNEQHLQDITVEPVVRLIIDYLLVIFGDREPNAYTRLMAVLTAYFSDEQQHTQQRYSWLEFIKRETQKAKLSEQLGGDFRSRWGFVVAFVKEFGRGRLISLSPDYESPARLREVVQIIKSHLNESADRGADIVSSLSLLTDNQAIRMMTIHKSKGLEFDTVVILGVETQLFWGNINDARCAFFVGISRAKRQVVLTTANLRPRPSGFTQFWRTNRTPQQEFLGYADVKTDI